MAAQQRRLLHANTSKLGKVDITRVLRKADSWTLLPRETRERLYAMLPQPQDDDPPIDVDIHPLKTHYKQYIEVELRLWQEDLRDGREGKKWREAAIQASNDRANGKFDEWTEMQREEYWGPREEGEAKVVFKPRVAAVKNAENDLEINGNGNGQFRPAHEEKLNEGETEQKAPEAEDCVIAEEDFRTPTHRDASEEEL